MACGILESQAPTNFCKGLFWSLCALTCLMDVVKSASNKGTLGNPSGNGAKWRC